MAGQKKRKKKKHQKGLPIKRTKCVYAKERSGMRADPNENQGGNLERELANRL